MIKKLLITLIVWSWIRLLNYSNATVQGYTSTFWTTTSQYDNAYSMQVTFKWWLNTTYMWNNRNILMYSKWNYFFRDNNGDPYIWFNNWTANWQGYPDDFLLCNSFTSNTITNCSRQYIVNNDEIINWVLNNVNFYYYWKFVQSNEVWENYQWSLFCFSNNTYNKSICFYACWHTNCWSSTTDKIGGATLHKNLTNSQNFWQNLIDIPTNKIWTNDVYIPNTTPNTSKNIYCPRISELMKNAGEQYNTWLCYNDTLYMNWTQFETIEKKDIFTVFNNDYQEYINRVWLYRNNCRAPATQESCGNAFSGEFEKFSIISKAIRNNAEEKTLRNYCNIWLNYDPNATTCVASGYIKEEYTNEELIQAIVNREYELITPNTWTVFDSLTEQWIENNARDIIWSLERIYTKITWLFKNRSGVNGIIPDYIMWFCFITILFTIIFKK